MHAIFRNDRHRGIQSSPAYACNGTRPSRGASSSSIRARHRRLDVRSRFSTARHQRVRSPRPFRLSRCTDLARFNAPSARAKRERCVSFRHDVLFRHHCVERGLRPGGSAVRLLPRIRAIVRYACRSAVLVSDIDSDSSKVEEDREASASMQTVLSSTRCAWGFELDLECGHRRFYFTHDDSPPPLAGCYECSYPRSGPASLSSHPSSSRRRAVDTSTFLEASDDDRVARRGTE